ncbi:MAG: GHMP kinase [Eubacterium sp.]
MRTVTVKAPGSCGEFIQGIYESQPCLVSCPIDLYSSIRISEGQPTRMLDEKAVQMLDLIFREYDLPRDEKHRINIHLASDIPVEKGMASSTADIAGIARGISEYYNLGFDNQTIANLCICIEPTDNIMFERLNLFNHMRGDVIMNFETQLEASILIVAFKGRVNTVNFHGQQEGYTTDEVNRFEKAVQLFKFGLQSKDLDVIGKACTESARLNQKILYKPHLETMAKLSQNFGGHGVLTGHSGTVIGVLYSEDSFDYKAFMQQFLNSVPKEDYDALFLKNIIPGGLQVSVDH